MSAGNITGIALADKPAWHGMGIIHNGLMNIDEALELSGNNWPIEKRPLYVNIGTDENPNFIIAQDPDREDGKPGAIAYGTVRMDDDVTKRRVVGCSVSEKYVPLQNRTLFTLAEELTGGTGEARFETAGQFSYGRRVWTLIEFKSGEQFTVVGDQVQRYLLLVNGHDGLHRLTIVQTPVRVVCQNTLNAAVNGAERIFGARHMGNQMDPESLRKEAARILDLTGSYYDRYKAEAEVMATQSLSVSERDAVIAELFPLPEDAGKKKVTIVNKARNIVLECLAKADLANHANTAWGLYNAVADYSDHERTLKFLESDPNRAKENAFLRTFENTLLKDKAFELLAALR